VVNRGGKYFLDIAKANRYQALSMGVLRRIYGCLMNAPSVCLRNIIPTGSPKVPQGDRAVHRDCSVEF